MIFTVGDQEYDFDMDTFLYIYFRLNNQLGEPEGSD